MEMPPKITFVVAANNDDVLGKNLLVSPSLSPNEPHQLIVQKGFTSAAKAYNAALKNCVNDLVVFVHQDVFLPDPWLSSLQLALDNLSKKDPAWGVLGCWGLKEDGEGVGHVYTPGLGVIGRSFEHPVPVQTLDEIVLIIRKSSGLTFDERLPGFHFYGTDISMRAASNGQQCYAISAFCIHNAREYYSYPREFYQAYWEIKRIWKHVLPVQSSCVRISRFDGDLRGQQLKRGLFRIIHRAAQRGDRHLDPRSILEMLQINRQI